jgi:hypothetical protein
LLRCPGWLVARPGTGVETEVRAANRRSVATDRANVLHMNRDSQFTNRGNLPTAAVQAASVALLSGDPPPAALDDLARRISPRPLLLIYGSDGQAGERELNPRYFEAPGEPSGKDNVWSILDGCRKSGWETTAAALVRSGGTRHRRRAAPDAAAVPRSSATARMRVHVQAFTGSVRSGSLSPTAFEMTQTMNQSSVTEFLLWVGRSDFRSRFPGSSRGAMILRWKARDSPD